MQLLELESGRISLEFQSEEFDSVIAQLLSFGSAKARAGKISDEVFVNDQRFIYLDEWGDRCLISTSILGDQMLIDIGRSNGIFSPRSKVSGEVVLMNFR